jgi:hypothetical protein
VRLSPIHQGPQCRTTSTSPLHWDHPIIGAEQSFDLHALLQSTSRTLSNLDFEHRHEMQRVECGRTNPALKRQIIDNLKRRHRERRQPYVTLTAELQSHLSSAVSDDLKAAG